MKTTEPSDNLLAAANLLAHSIASKHEAPEGGPAFSSKGSEAHLDERERRLTALVAEGAAVHERAQRALESELRSRDSDLTYAREKLESIVRAMEMCRERAQDHADIIADNKRAIARLEQEIADHNQRRERALERDLPDLDAKRGKAALAVEAAEKVVEGIRARHAKPIKEAERARERLRMRLVRLQLRRPKVAP